MEKPKRYSDEVPYEKRRYWYFTLHGTGPGTIPKDLKVLEVREGQNEKGTWGTYICLDGIVNTSELKEFDLKELIPPDDETSIEQVIKDYLKHEGWSGSIDCIWEDTDGLHIYVLDGDWKHQHLFLKHLMEQFGYTFVQENPEPSEDDCYTAEHIYKK